VGNGIARYVSDEGATGNFALQSFVMKVLITHQEARGLRVELLTERHDVESVLKKIK
jgi:hypothetical protein